MRDEDASSHRRPRPVADAPIAAYAAGTGLAKAWLLELLEALPLEHAGRLPAARLAAEAPALCAALCRGLTDDAALDALAPGGPDARLAAHVAELAAARDAPATVAAVEALRRVTWRALRDEMRAPEARTVADLADRLAHVCGVIAQSALADAEHRARPAGHDADPDGPVAARDARLSVVPAAHEGSGGWEAALSRRLERWERDGDPFALVVVEIDDIERLLAAHDPEELATAVRAVERALSDLLGPGDVLSREDTGRYWMTLGGIDRPAARELIERAAEVVAAEAVLAGAGLAVCAGVAHCPQDGREADALADLAQDGVLLARAAGVPITG